MKTLETFGALLLHMESRLNAFPLSGKVDPLRAKMEIKIFLTNGGPRGRE